MNTSALKTFAPAVRKQLMEAVTRKLDFALTAQTPDYLTTFAPQVAALRKLAQADRPGLIERVAYTWFNRFAALRFMDARGWHPFRARVLTPASAAETQPELLKLTRTDALPEELKSHTDPARLNDLLDGRIPSPDAQGEVYRHLVLAACRFYHALLPNLFEKLDDETELLLPDDLLTEHSVVHGFRTEISDEDCGDGQRANVEILGWLYQFYISERRDQVMARKSAVPTEDIPAVTQLFTPHWIVRYLVENSLGRLWLLNRPGSRLREHMPYYIGESSAGILPASASVGGEAGGTPALRSGGEAGGTPALRSFLPFDPRATVETTRRHLPHWQQEGTTYFITFRLGDSIPQEKLALWESERNHWISVHPEPWDEQSIAEYTTLFPERRQQWLDNGYGRCLLRLPAIAEIVRTALFHFDGQRYLLDEFVLMPNHVHLLVKPLPGHDLSALLHSWKSFTAKAINKAIGATGTVWQDESYDHIVRSSAQLEFYRNYIRENPIKAGLENIRAESGAGILPAIAEGEAGGTPALLSFQPSKSGAGILPAIPAEAAGETPAPLFLKITKPEEIRLCDPAVGSAHMLTYAFDLLTLIYEEEGYAPTEIPALILRHNLHGLEICPRAAQLAELALVFKAREKSRRFFQPEHLVRPRIIELRDVRFAENELRDTIHALGLGDLFNQPMLRLLHQFEKAKNFGSLIQPCLDERAIAAARRAIEAKDLGGQLFLRATHLKVLRVLEQAEALTQRYHVVVANPPYMGSKGMNDYLKQFAKDNYPNSKSDLFAMFMERGFSLVAQKGYTGMITMQSWMFLSSYEELRTDIVSNKTFLSMAHLGARAFDTIGGEVVQSTAFVLANEASTLSVSTFVRLVTGGTEAEKSAQYLEAISNPACGWCYRTRAADFKKFPGSPIAYWARNYVGLYVDDATLSSSHEPKKGILTSDNDRFLRRWFEVSTSKFVVTCKSCAESENSGGKWFPMNKGGSAQRWYGNHEYVMNWEFNGREMREWERHIQETRNAGGRVINEDCYFQEGITWSDIGSTQIAFRQLPRGFIFNARGPAFFLRGEDQSRLLGFLNSSLVAEILQLINPTICLNPSDVGRLPPPKRVECSETVEKLVDVARADWDNFETSWDFRDQPLLRPGLKGATLEASWRNWEAQSAAAIRRMQELETENNRLFIAAYGLEGELEPAVPEAQITLARAEARRDLAAFLSYAVGCMMGRYGLDHPGLILANAGDTLENYWKKVGQASCLPSSSQAGRLPAPLFQSGAGVPPAAEKEAAGKMPAPLFSPDQDGIIPVLDGEWFEDDIVARTRDFLRATFGEATLRENLRFLEDSLGKDLRKYFLTDFYKDHLQTYKKRPIYWLVQSPKKGFSVLLYLHRYTRDTMNLVLNRYLRDYQVKLRNRLAHLTQEQATAGTAKAKTDARKEADKLAKTLHECDDWERQTVLPLAQARIELDLDDGVKTNYLKLGEALAPIVGLVKEED